jgi:multidrug transporter EmrE-like cation transporter
MTTSTLERALLPAVALQGAISALGGFIGFFIMAVHSVDAMFMFTAIMQTSATAATFLAYLSGPRFRIDGRRLLKLGFLLPGLLLLFGDGSLVALGVAFGSFIGLTWSARHWLEMSLLRDAERDAYAAHSGAWTVALGVVATLLTTLLLAAAGDHSQLVYRLYGAAAVIGALALGNRLPQTRPVSIRKPLAVIRQPEFIACLPLFFLESGLFGIGQSLASAGAAKALGSASDFGWVATVAGLAGCVALYLTKKNRGVNNRMHWLGGSCLVVGLSFALLGASAWIPALFVGYSVLKAAGGPFLAASEQVLNQRTLDIRGALSDRIFAREVVLWMLRMISLFLFWGLTSHLQPTAVLVIGSALLAIATGMEYVAGKALFWSADTALEQAA